MAQKRGASISRRVCLTALAYSAALSDARAQTPEDEATETAGDEKTVDSLNSLSKELGNFVKTVKDATAEKDKQIAAAEEAREKAETEAASVRSGKLIQYGITAGIGPVMHTPLYRRPTPGLGVMPYIMFHPTYWGNKPQLDRYCANIWAGRQSHEAASKASDGDAWKRAERRTESLFAAIRVDPNVTLEQLTAAEPSNRAEARVQGLLRDLRVVAAGAQYPETMGSLGKVERARIRRARSPSFKASDIKGIFEEVAPCKTPKSKLREKLCEMGGASQNVGDVLAIAVATQLVEDLEGELEWVRRKTDDVLEDAVENILEDTPETLTELAESLSHPDHARFTSEHPWRSDLDGITRADLDRAKEIVNAQDTKLTTVMVNGRNAVPLETLRHALISEMQVHTIGWKVDLPGKCGSRRFFGLWLGYPLKYKTTVPTQLGDMPVLRKQLQVTEIIAAGYGMSPNAYISILFGFGVGLTNIPPGDRDREVVWSFIIGLGGNLDLFTLLRG